ncbi:MAG TPA: Mur ligase domain-containing protein, partial [Candidatus Omnitrophota bacterium]|nr:Mur ligase domain-containing protein [Candidatus Omnitrophota bacterium]
MRLRSLLKRIDPESDCGADLEISGIFANSKEVKAGSLFAAVKGVKADGNEFIAEAVANGAVCVMAEDICLAGKYPEVEFVRVKDSRQALAVLADEFFNHPSGRIKVVGITGTNGKTTITYLIRAILEQAGLSSGIIGTINYSFKDKVLPAVNTTP